MPEISPRKCRICECTENDPCEGGCAWAEPNLCSTCASIQVLLVAWWFEAGPETAIDPHRKLTTLIEDTKRTLGETAPAPRLIGKSPLILLS